MGIVGPTRKGEFIVRAQPQGLALLRERLLGISSQFAHQWDLNIQHRFVGRFRDHLAAHTIVESLRQTLHWGCVILQERKAGRDHRLITLGAQTPPPDMVIALDGDIVVLREITKVTSGPQLQPSFVAPTPMQNSSATSMDTSPHIALPEAIDLKCQDAVDTASTKIDLHLRAVEARIDKVLGDASAKIEERSQDQLKAAQTLSEALNDKLELQQQQLDRQEQRFSDMDAKWSKTFGSFQESFETRFTTVESIVAQQGKQIQDTAQTFQAQLQDFGTKLLAQIAAAQDDKRRKIHGGEDSHMSGDATSSRGGMYSKSSSSLADTHANTQFWSTLEKRVLTLSGLGGQSPPTHTECIGTEQEDAPRPNEGLLPQIQYDAQVASSINNPTSSQTETGRSEEPQGSDSRCQESRRSEEPQGIDSRSEENRGHKRALSRVRGGRSAQVASSLASSQSEDHVPETARQKHARMAGHRPMMWKRSLQPAKGQHTPLLKAREESFPDNAHIPQQRDQAPRRRMTDNNSQHMEPRICQELVEHRRQHRHTDTHWLYLLRDMVPVDPEIPANCPRAEPKKRIMGPAVSCWFCGVTYVASYRRTAQAQNCQLAQLERVQDWRKIRRLVIDKHSLNRVQSWLSEINKLPERCDLHWPHLVYNLENAEGEPTGWTLECRRCGLMSPTSRKMAFIATPCREAKKARSVGLQQCRKDAVNDPTCLPPSLASLRGGDMIRIGTLNVGTARNRWEQIYQADVHILGLQETCISPTQMSSQKAALKGLGGSIVFGSVSPSSLIHRGSAIRTRMGIGVAVVSFHPVRVIPTATLWGPSPHPTLVTDRIVSAIAVWNTNKIIVHSLYFQANGRDQKITNNALLDELTRRMSLRPFACHAIVGDFQEDFAATGLGVHLAQNGWIIHGNLLHRQPSNHPPFGQHRRLDDIGISSNLSQSLRGAKQVALCGFSSHDLLFLEFDFSEEVISGDKLENIPIRELEALLQDAQYRPWPASEGPMRDAQAGYDHWLDRLNQWLQPPAPIGRLRVSGSQVCKEGKAPIRNRRFVRQNLLCKVDAWHRELGVLARRCIQMGSGPTPGKMVTLLESLAKQPWHAWGAFPPKISAEMSLADLQHYVYWMEEVWPDIRAEADVRAKSSLKTWRDGFLDQIRLGKCGGVSRWVKGPPMSTVLDAQDDIIAHPLQVVRQLKTDWEAIYLKPPVLENEPHSSGLRLRCVCPGQAHVPVVLPHLLPSDLKRMAFSKPETACGGDQLPWKLFRTLPDEAWHELCEILRLVEGGQAWPEPLTQVVMAPIPKKGAGEGAPVKSLKARLISVAPFLYRIWASARARQLSETWAPSHVPGCIYGGTPGKDAKLAAWVEGTLWDQAQQESTPLWGVYLDFSKFYDSLDCSMLRRAMIHFGVDQTITDALFRWQDVHTRRIAMRGWASSSFHPTRGIPQGCPLAVLQAVVCAMSWAGLVEATVRPDPYAGFNALPTLLAYLDDWTIISPSHGLLAEIVGLTGIWATDWGVSLNPDKCGVACNKLAKSLGVRHPVFDKMPLVDDQSLLGHDAGPLPTSLQQVSRCHDAATRLQRFIDLRLPQWAFRKLCKAFVSPLLYGIHTSPLLADHHKLETLIRHGSWGKARCASNWNLAQAVAFPASRLTPRSFQFFEAFQVLYQACRHETHRLRLLHLWHSGHGVDRKGPWQQFLQVVQDTAGNIRPGGVVAWPRIRLEINLHMPKHWLVHWLRLAWRSHLLAEAALRLPWLRDDAPHVDWHATRRSLVRHTPAHQTILAHGVNTKSRSFRHHGSGSSPHCEHGCCDALDQPLDDHPEHRLLWCRGTEDLREACFSQEHIEYLRTLPLCTTRCAIWLVPPCCRGLEIPCRRAWGLWPTEKLITDLLDIQQPGFAMREAKIEFWYDSRDFGDHPLLKVHSAQILLPGNLGSLAATAQHSAYGRADWEIEAFMLSGIIAAIWRVDVAIWGLSSSREKLVSELQSKRISNAYLSELVLQQLVRIQVQDRRATNQPAAHGHLDDGFRPDPHQIQILERQWEIAERLVAFNSRVLDCYPMAHQLSRFQGLAPHPPPYPRFGGGRCGGVRQHDQSAFAQTIRPAEHVSEGGF